MQHSPSDLRKKVLGRRGEGLACKYLKKQGYKILKRNYKTPFGEADIVAEKDGYICFVEVKARTSDSFGLPVEAVTRDKQRRYRNIAGYYCACIGEEVAIRFDVVSIFGEQIEHFENAFA